MSKIKWEDDKVIILYTEAGIGLYDTPKNYKIDLTNRKHYLLKNDEEHEIEWNMELEEEENFIYNFKKEISFRIENNLNIIYQSEQKNDIKELERTKKFLEKNKKIKEFLDNYKFSIE